MTLIEENNFEESAEITTVFCKLTNYLLDLMNSKKVTKNNIEE